MSEDPMLRRMLRELRNEPSPLRSAQEQAQRTQRHVAFLDQMLEARRTRRRWPWALSAAATLVALPGAVHWLEASPSLPVGAAVSAGASARAAGRATVLRDPEVTALEGAVRVESANAANERTIRTTAPLARGDRLRVDASARAVVRLGNGSMVNVAESTALRLEGSVEGEALSVSSGRVDLSVPPLRPRSLSVVTPDARVTVVGTRFSVVVEAGTPQQPGRTCVSVSEGRVSVAHAAVDTLLEPGARWSSDGKLCGVSPSRVEPRASATPAETRLPERASPAPSFAPESPLPPTPESPASLLAEQNRLFASALRAREQGRSARARALLEEFLSRFPDAALAPQARRELDRIESPSKP